MITMRTYLILLLSILAVQLQAQTDFYDQLKTDYDRLRIEEKHDSALTVAKQMNAWAFKNETDTSLRYAVSLRYVGNCFNSLNKFDSCEYFYRRSLLTFKSRKDTLSLDFAELNLDFGIISFIKSKYDIASFYLKIAAGIGNDDFASKSINAKSLYYLGFLHAELSDFQRAMEFYEMALEINKEIYGLESEQCARVLNAIGYDYLMIGDYYAAEENLTKSLVIFEKIFGEQHPAYTFPLGNLGRMYYFNKDYNKALLFCERATDIYEITKGSTSPLLSIGLTFVGDIYMALGLEHKADSVLKKALGIIEINYGKEHPRYAWGLSNLGKLSVKFGQNDNAASYFLNAINIYNKNKYSDVWNRFDCENYYANLLNLENRSSEANQILKNNFYKKSKQIADNFEWLNDNQKEAYWKKESSFYDNLSWFANEAFGKVPEAVGLNYNAALVTKSKMLEAKISSENYYREVDELREELAYRRRLLAKMESDGSTEKERLEKLRNEADSLDKRLTLSWPEYAQQKKNLSITWDQVQQNLNNGEAAIEFVRFKNEYDSLVYYNALVLKKGDKNPTLVKLCKENDLQSIIPKLGYSAYYPLIWQPLEAALKDVKTIYYAPTGELYNVPFHTIYAPKGKGDEVFAAKTDKRGVIIQYERTATEQNAEYLMDRYVMHQLTSTRYLAMGLKQKAREPIGNTMAMVGGVNYDYLPGSSDVSKKNKKDKHASRSSASVSGKLNYLEGTKTEIEQINLQLSAATWQTKLIENNEAIEENITKLEGKEAKGILHLATHGYAFPEYDFNDTTISKNSLRYNYRYSTNPMVRSGLILAGGNWAWTGSDTLSKLGAEQNGILTALEVSQLNLKNTKLVVLSACETGLGKIEGSEGTFGLKRGFKLAGVEQMIVSLWSVPDKETMELMTLFYTDLTTTLNPVVSFEKAQKQMRMNYPTEPEKWAGFVLVR